MCNKTQFWDANPATGPSDSWTIHGLWPDHCDGTYDANCDPSRAYTNISSILTAAGASSVLSYMNTYWKDVNGNDESFWDHEWEKHGTCISTLQPSCYTNYAMQEEVVDYFTTTVNLFQTLPSYTWLSNAGIVPSTTATYTSAAIMAALKTPRGVDVVIQCKNTNELDEIWYFYDVQGSVQTGTFIPTAPGTHHRAISRLKYMLTLRIQMAPKAPAQPQASNTCPRPARPPSATTTTTTTPPGTTPTTAPGTPFSGRGTLQVSTSGQSNGCIISGGTWYTTGTCAGFTATASGTGFTLTSSKGLCAVQNFRLVCASTVTAGTVFTSSGGQLAYNGSPAFYASSVPSGSTQAVVSTTRLATGLVIAWQGL